MTIRIRLETSVAAGKFIGLPAFPGPDRHIDVDVADHHLLVALLGRPTRRLRGREPDSSAVAAKAAIEHKAHAATMRRNLRSQEPGPRRHVRFL